MKETATASGYVLYLAEGVLLDLQDTHRALEPKPGAKTAGWLLGHLAFTGDYARGLCGQSALCPDTWPTLFAPGTRPSLNSEDYPPMATLKGTLLAVYSDLREIAPKTSGEVLEAANPYAPAQKAFPTVGDFLAYVMTAHLAYHLGQLAGWRAAAGLGRVQR